MTKEETIIELDKVIAMIPENNKEELFMYLSSDCDYSEKTYKGFSIVKSSLIPQTTVILAPTIFT